MGSAIMKCKLPVHRRACGAVFATIILLFVQAGRAAADASELYILLVIDSHAGKLSNSFETHCRHHLQNLAYVRRIIRDVYNDAGASFKNKIYLDIIEGAKVSPDRIGLSLRKGPA